MKKALIVLLALVMMFSVCACSSEPAAGNKDSDEPAKVDDSTPAQVEDTTDPVVDGEGDLGDYHIKIVSAAKAKDYEGADVLVVTYEWTNNSDDATMFSTAFTAKAYQNGIECTAAYVVDGVDAEKSMTNIQPGATLEVQEAYKLNDASDVSVEVTEWISFSDAKVTKTFTLG